MKLKGACVGRMRDSPGTVPMGITSRRIEQYEQRVRDINAARADAFLALATALGCAPGDLIERVPPVKKTGDET